MDETLFQKLNKQQSNRRGWESGLTVQLWPSKCTTLGLSLSAENTMPCFRHLMGPLWDCLSLRRLSCQVLSWSTSPAIERRCKQPGMEAHICNTSTQEGEIRGTDIQSYPLLHSEFKSSLGYMWPSLKAFIYTGACASNSCQSETAVIWDFPLSLWCFRPAPVSLTSL